MNAPKENKLLDALFAQTPEEMAKRATDVRLDAPEAIAQEERVLLAVLQSAQDSHAQDEHEQARASWWQLWKQPGRSFTALHFATAAALLLTVVPASLYLTRVPATTSKTPPHRSAGHRSAPSLFPKGQGSKKHAKEVTLQVGTWKASSRRIQPLSSGQALSPRDSLVFGFKLTKTKGFLYLFHQRPGALGQIFPLPGKRTSLRTPQAQVQLLQSTGAPQQYTLQGERGLQRFLLLVTQRPLRTEEKARWRREHMKQKPGTLQQSLQRSALHAVVVGWDVFSLRILASPRKRRTAP